MKLLSADVCGRKSSKDMVKEVILYLMIHNKENDVALFPEVNFIIWMSYPCGILHLQSIICFPCGKIVSSVNRNVGFFPNRESLFDMLFKCYG